MKKIKILQPGRIGDILLVLPIAKYYHDQGYCIIWPVCSLYFPLLQYVDYVKGYDIGGLKGWRKKALNICPEAEILDLSIGFGNGEEWKTDRLSFDQWKYRRSGVNFQEKYNLQINRDLAKEEELFQQFGFRLGSGYDVIHDSGSGGRHHDFRPKEQAGFVRIMPLDGYTIFDWRRILERARRIYCVDSCAGILIDQLGIGFGRRYFHPWSEYYSDTDLLILTPKISSGWEIV